MCCGKGTIGGACRGSREKSGKAMRLEGLGAMGGGTKILKHGMVKSLEVLRFIAGYGDM